MEIYRKTAKVTLSPVKVHPDLKGNVISITNDVEKNYTDTMIYLLELGVEAHLKSKISGGTPYTEDNFPVPINDTVEKPKPVITTKVAINPVIKKEPKHNKAAFMANLISRGADPQHTADWMTTRKVFTETAFKSTLTQIEKSGLTVAQAVEMAAENGWKGFKASYVNESFDVATARGGVSQASKYDNPSQPALIGESYES